jgi:hypothetical protein
MSLFAWMAGFESSQPEVSGLLASDPSLFELCPEVVPILDPLLPTPSWVITNAGMETTTALDCAVDTKYTAIRAVFNRTHNTHFSRSPNRLSYRLFLHCRVADENEDVSNGTRPLEGLAIWVKKITSGFVRYQPTELISIKQSDMEFNDASPIRIAMTLTAKQASATSSSRLWSKTLRIDWAIVPSDVQLEVTYHPAHLWNRETFHFRNVLLDHQPQKSFVMGAVQITVTHRAGGEPFPRECWLLCGFVPREGRGLEPWVELVVCQKADDSVTIFGQQTCSRRALINPFVFSTLVAKLKERGLLPDPATLTASCDLECTPKRSACLRLRASEFTQDEPDNPWAYRVTIHGENLDFGLGRRKVRDDPGTVSPRRSPHPRRQIVILTTTAAIAPTQNDSHSRLTTPRVVKAALDRR